MKETFTAQELRDRSDALLASACRNMDCRSGECLALKNNAAMLRYAAQMRERLDGLEKWLRIQRAGYHVEAQVGGAEHRQQAREVRKVIDGALVVLLLDAAPVSPASAAIDPERKGPRG